LALDVPLASKGPVPFDLAFILVFRAQDGGGRRAKSKPDGFNVTMR
jgi:hypothetical protein